MIFRWCVAIVMLGCMARSADSQEKRAPAGPPPRFQQIADFDKKQGAIFLREILYEIVPRTEQRQVQMGDRIVVQEYTVAVKVPVERVVKVAIREVQFLDGEGKRVALEDAERRLSAGMVVLVAAQGMPVDRAFLNLLRREALILVTPGPAVPSGNAPMPLPEVLPPPPSPE